MSENHVTEEFVSPADVISIIEIIGCILHKRKELHRYDKKSYCCCNGSRKPSGRHFFPDKCLQERRTGYIKERS